MAHYAFLDENNIVTEVIVGIDETELIEGLDPETWYGNFRGQKCVRTSYNGNIRKNYAGIGFIYDETRDAFVEPNPEVDGYVLNEETLRWEFTGTIVIEPVAIEETVVVEESPAAEEETTEQEPTDV
jgi:hypothetical protein